MTAPVRWVADEMLPEVVVAGRMRLDDLSADDAAYVVARLTRQGASVREIAGRLGCTERHVKRIRAGAAVQLQLQVWEREREIDRLHGVIRSLWAEVEWATKAGARFLRRGAQ